MHRALHHQQHEATCAVACVRTVLHRQFGLRIAERTLVTLGTNPSKPILRKGSYTFHMRRMVRLASEAHNAGPPWKLFVRSKGCFSDLLRELGQGRWPICQTYVPQMREHHAVVVMDLTPTHVLVFDPDPSSGAEPQWFTHEAFYDNWYSPRDRHSTWYCVITGGVLKEG